MFVVRAVCVELPLCAIVSGFNMHQRFHTLSMKRAKWLKMRTITVPKPRHPTHTPVRLALPPNTCEGL